MSRPERLGRTIAVLQIMEGEVTRWPAARDSELRETDGDGRETGEPAQPRFLLFVVLRFD